MRDPRTGHRQTQPAHALSVAPVLTAWLAAIGVDLLFNAGLFSPLFDQAREPGLLDDETLFRRIPVAYLALLVGVAGLAWLLDRTDRRGIGQGSVVGAIAGSVAALLGVVSVWTAVDMTTAFVAAAVVVQVGQLGAAGAVLGAYRSGADRRRVTRWALAASVAAVLLAVLAQNVLAGFA